MAEMIEDLLQYRLMAHPEYVHRSIHIRPTIDGGLRIEIDGSFYEGIGDLTDEEVRTFLQEIVREWEARQ